MNNLKKIFVYMLFLAGCSSNDFQTTNYPSGKLKSRCEESNRGSFICEQFYESGKIMSKCKELNDSSYTCNHFYESGILKSTELYVNDSLDGIAQYYDSIGNLIFVSEYKKGIQDGIFKEYYDDGKLKQEGKYFKGNQIGWIKRYYNSGTIKEEVQYVFNGRESELSQFKKYNNDGVLIIEESHFIEIEYKKDADGDTSIILKVIPLDIEHDKARLIIGYFNSQYDLLNADTTVFFAENLLFEFKKSVLDQYHDSLGVVVDNYKEVFSNGEMYWDVHRMYATSNFQTK